MSANRLSRNGSAWNATRRFFASLIALALVLALAGCQSASHRKNSNSASDRVAKDIAGKPIIYDPKKGMDGKLFNEREK